MADPLPATVPPPAPPGSPDAWYAPTVRTQYAVGRNLVATVRDRDGGFAYEVREPSRSNATDLAVRTVTDHLADADTDRPRTREGTAERMDDGLGPALDRVVDRLTDLSPDQRRRLEYAVTAALRGVGALTPLALDDRIRVADASGDRVVVHTVDFAPARTDVSTDEPSLDRFLSERVASYEVAVHGTDVPVTVFRERVLGGDAFDTKYHVHSPDRLPGDDDLVARVKTRLVNESVNGRVRDPVTHVRRRARRLLARELVAGSPRTALAGVGRRLRAMVSRVGLGDPPLPRRTSSDRIDDLVYVVLRDLVAEDRLSVPIRDPHLERIEANRVGERVKVVPKPGTFDQAGRMPTTTTIDDERRFVTLATRLAGAGGVELGPQTPAATVTIEPTPGSPVTCSVALPDHRTDGAYVAIDKRGLDPVTPVELIDAGTIDPELVALLWLAMERRQVVAFVGPERARPAALVEAHAPFIPYGDRPVTVSGGTRRLTLPHETGVSLTTGAAETAATEGRSSLDQAADLVPDVTVVTDLDGETTYHHLADAIDAGRGVLVAAHADGLASFAHRAVANGVPRQTLGGVDLVVVVGAPDGTPRVTAVEMPSRTEPVSGRAVLDGDDATLFATTIDGAPASDGRTGSDGDSASASIDVRPVLSEMASRMGEQVADLSTEYERRERYVRYLATAGVTDADDLFAFLADLRTDEAATVERIHRVLAG